MNKIKKRIFICNFTKTISSAVLTAIAINIIMTNATKYAFIEGLLPFTLAIVIVAIIDIYEYRCEREDKISLYELEDRIEKLEGEMAAASTDFVKLNQIIADKEAAEKLAALGYTNIVEFGGILDWTGDVVSEG